MPLPALSASSCALFPFRVPLPRTFFSFSSLSLPSFFRFSTPSLFSARPPHRFHPSPKNYRHAVFTDPPRKLPARRGHPLRGTTQHGRRHRRPAPGCHHRSHPRSQTLCLRHLGRIRRRARPAALPMPTPPFVYRSFPAFFVCLSHSRSGIPAFILRRITAGGCRTRPQHRAAGPPGRSAPGAVPGPAPPR